MTEQRDAEEILEQSKQQRRHQTEPSQQPDAGTETPLVDAITDALHAIDDPGESLHPNVTVRDPRLAALFDALETTNGLEDVGDRAAEYLDRSEVPESKNAVAAALLRVGLAEVAEEEIEAGLEAYNRYRRESEEGF